MAKLSLTGTQLWSKLHDRVVGDRPDGLPASGKMYHVTTRDNLDAIARNGLQPRSAPSGVFNSDYDALKNLHGIQETPPFVARRDNEMFDRVRDYHASTGNETVMLEVDVRGLKTGVDINALADFGAGFTQDEGGAWVVFVSRKNFRHLNETPFEREFGSELGRDEEMALSRFKNPALAAKAMKLTGSIVVLEPIPPERIRVVNERRSLGSTSELTRNVDREVGAELPRPDQPPAFHHHAQHPLVPKTEATMTDDKKPFHERVAEKIIDQLKAGTAPWQRPWNPAEPGAEGRSIIPMNPTTGKRYRGVNVVNLMSQGHDDNRWMTYKQAAAAGAQVRKGEKGSPVQYWKFDEEQALKDAQGKPVKDAEGNQVKVRVELERPRPFYAVVFNAEQIDGLPARTPPRAPEWDPIERADALLRASGAKITERSSSRAYYSPGTDSITLPERSQFPTADRFYGTALHEVGHWTGHPTRLNRDLAHPFGSEGYAKEELRAEIASMILGDELRIGHDPAQHVAYVASWIKALEDDPMEIVRACSDAEKINTFILAFEQKQSQQLEPVQIAGTDDLVDQVRRNALAFPVAHVLFDRDMQFDHYREFRRQADPVAGYPSLPHALARSGFHTIADVVGPDTAPANMFAKAQERLSEFFGIPIDSTGDEAEFNAYLERKGLASAMAEAAADLITARTTAPAVMLSSYEIALGKAMEAGSDLPDAIEAASRAPDAATDEIARSVPQGEFSRETWERLGRQIVGSDVAQTGESRADALFASRRASASTQIAEAVQLATVDGRLVTAPQQESGVPTPLQVPFREKGEAKQLGARWNKEDKIWEVPAGIDPTPFAKWNKPATPAEEPHPAPAEIAMTTTTRSIPSSEQEDSRMAVRGDAPGAGSTRQYLAVPYGERNVAKAAGAKWDAAAKSWYVPEGRDATKLARWQPDPMGNRQTEAVKPDVEFAGAMKAMGLEVPGGHPIMDGKTHRVPAEGDTKGERAGFYVAHLDGHPAGYIKNNRSGLDMRWKSSGYSLSEEEKAQLNAEAATKREAREREQTATYEETATKVQRRAASYQQLTTPTPYMVRKGIEPTIGAMTDGRDGTIHLPAIDANGKHWTTQHIQEDGTKRYAKDSHKEGCFHVVNGGATPQEALAALAAAPRLMIGEGYATMNDVGSVVQHPTVAAFDSGNLPTVAKALHERFSDKPIFIVGEDDQRVLAEYGYNPGREKAIEAAAEVGGKPMFPTFAPGEQAADPKRFTDFNDLAQNSTLGREGLERQIRAAIESPRMQAIPAARIRIEEDVQQGRSGPSIGNDQPAQRRGGRR